MIRKILDWIVAFILRLYNDPIVREVAMTTLKTVAVEFKDAFKNTLVAVQEANTKKLTGEKKKEFVLKAMKDEFSDIPVAVQNKLIEDALAWVNKQEG